MDLVFALEHLPRLLKATILTIELTFLSLFFGIFVGVFFAILRTNKNKILFYISYYSSILIKMGAWSEPITSGSIIDCLILDLIFSDTQK